MKNKEITIKSWDENVTITEAENKELYKVLVWVEENKNKITGYFMTEEEESFNLTLEELKEKLYNAYVNNGIDAHNFTKNKYLYHDGGYIFIETSEYIEPIAKSVVKSVAETEPVTEAVAEIEKTIDTPLQLFLPEFTGEEFVEMSIDDFLKVAKGGFTKIRAKISIATAREVFKKCNRYSHKQRIYKYFPELKEEIEV